MRAALALTFFNLELKCERNKLVGSFRKKYSLHMMKVAM